MKSNMHIFEQCNQLQKEQEELLGIIRSVKELRPYRLQPQLLSTLTAPKAHHELMQLRPKPDIGMKFGGDEMKEETYGCDTPVCCMDGYMVGYRVKELDTSCIGDDLIYALTKHLGIPVVFTGGYAAYNIGHIDDCGNIDIWTLWPHNKMFTMDILKQLLSTKWSRHWNVKVSADLYPNVPNMKVFDITA